MSQQNDIMLSNGPPLILERRAYWGVDGVEKYMFRLLDSTHGLIRVFPSYGRAMTFWSMEYPFRALRSDRTTYRPREDKQPWVGKPYIDIGDYT